MVRRYLPQSAEELIRWYERYISPLSLLVGFAIDIVASQVLDLETYSYVLLSYLVLAASGIIAIHMIETGRLRHRFFVSIAKFIPVAVQFSFGGLFSGFVILYSKSAAFAASWMFVVILAALLLGNERFRRIYSTFPVQVGILFFALFSFTIFYVPVALSTVGAWLFLASGVVSIAIISVYLFICAILLPQRMRETRVTTVRIIAGSFALIHALYFLDAIPPLPLALKDAGVFHSITRSGTDYAVTFETREWYEVYLRYETKFHRSSGESIYVYSAVFAPTGISTGLAHEWEYYDEVVGKWVTYDTVSFPISGGRADGYRGYTVLGSVRDGYWRVNVLTDYGKPIGRVNFEVITVEEPVVLESGVR